MSDMSEDLYSRSPNIIFSPNQNAMVDNGISPMTDLSMNLGVALKIRRNLAFSSAENTPVKRICTDENGPSNTRQCFSPNSANTRHRLSPNSANTPLISFLKNISASKAESKMTRTTEEENPDFIVRRRQSGKENASHYLHVPPRAYEDEDDSPSKLFLDPPSKCGITKHVSRSRLPLEEQDPNSLDSGYSNSGYSTVSEESKSPSSFRFLQPSGLAPRRSSTSEFSPRRFASACLSPGSSGMFTQKVVPSLSSTSDYGESKDDGFMEPLLEQSAEFMDQDESTQFPSEFNSLLHDPIFKQDQHMASPVSSLFVQSAITPTFQRQGYGARKNFQQTRSLSLKSNIKPNFEDVIKLDKENVGVKRSAEGSGQFLKRRKCSVNRLIITKEKGMSLSQPTTAPALSPSVGRGTLFDYGFKKTVKFQRSFSETEATIKQAVQKGASNPNLIGDFSMPCVLPLNLMGKHSDLKNISCDTLARLLKGEFDDTVESYIIVDCRYPYEYEGGHIKGAVNVYTKDQLLQEFIQKKRRSLSPPYAEMDTSSTAFFDFAPKAQITSEADCGKRNILIFHCEFSSERGPTLSRFLRSADREKNSIHYPRLDYPEVYLLEGGYSAFFKSYKELCEPCSYRPMLDPAHIENLRHFRAKSKSWVPDGRHKKYYGK